MARTEFRGTLRRVGNSLALLIPAREARKANLHEGTAVEASIAPSTQEALGLLADLGLGSFRRETEGRDQI